MEIIAVAESTRRRMSIREIVVVVVSIVVLLGALYAAVRAARRVALRSQRRNNLKQIGLAFFNFHDVYGHLPPAVRRDESGRPLCSWRFHILPFYEAIMLGIDYGSPWDDPVNRPLTARQFLAFCHSKDDGSLESLQTNVVAIVGPGTAFEEGRLEDVDSDTILVIKVAGFDAHWAEPGDLRIDQVPQSITAGPDGDGLCVLFADGSVWFLGAAVPFEDLKRFFTIEGAKQHDREQLLGPYVSRN